MHEFIEEYVADVVRAHDLSERLASSWRWGTR
jgi:hypothetical protein